MIHNKIVNKEIYQPLFTDGLKQVPGFFYCTIILKIEIKCRDLFKEKMENIIIEKRLLFDYDTVEFYSEEIVKDSQNLLTK